MTSTSISPHFRSMSWSSPLASLLVTATTIFSPRLFLLLLLPSSTTAQNRTFLVLPQGGGSSCQMPDSSLYYQPVIGVLSHPGDGASGRLNNGSHISNIPASYVKFVESGGARVVPIIFNEPLDVIYEKLNLVNGVLFTGGWAKKGLYYETARKIFLKVLEKNNAGGHFPLFAICLGFELLSMFVSKISTRTA